MTNTKAGTPPTTLSFFNYLVNPNGNHTRVTDTTGVTTYGYDSLDRLSSVTYPGPTTTTYGYDPNGNRTSTQVDANPATSYVSDAADQLTSVGGASNTYDANGNLTAVGGDGSTFLYDQEGRIFRAGPCRGDVNGDGTINILDLSTISARYQSVEGSSSYDLNFDLNGDGAINILDLTITSAQYNRSCVSTGTNTGEGRYVYNGDGLRVRSTTFPSGTLATDDYVWDQGAALPEVLQDTNSGTGTTTYVYGLSLISKTDGSGATSYSCRTASAARRSSPAHRAASPTATRTTSSARCARRRARRRTTS
ncbi:MAG: dockerin type I domain-containing protein, partial [Dehalococcoidia bacterium]